METFIYENINPSTPALKADLGYRRLWEAQMKTILFDARVVDTDTPSYLCQTLLQWDPGRF